MTAGVFNPVHEKFFEAATVYECEEWIRDFARENGNRPVIETGPRSRLVGNFTFLIFEKEEG
jgi:hypothetical protein